MTINITRIDNKYLVFDAEDIMRLRKNFNIVGKFIGNNYNFKQSTSQLSSFVSNSLPLILCKEEAFFLVSLGIAEVEESNGSGDCNAVENFKDTCQYHAVMHDEQNAEKIFVVNYLSQNFNIYLSNGLKFGGDFLVYFHDPISVHARYILKIFKNTTREIKEEEAKINFNLLELIKFGRLSNNVNKTFILADYDFKMNKCNFFEIKWTSWV
ncbi:hypothetical protein HDU92_002413 [Lobulomyces angularis]|nr:hypothetical protein HDU92_002413 [Lobulomyces angularis]